MIDILYLSDSSNCICYKNLLSIIGLKRPFYNIDFINYFSVRQGDLVCIKWQDKEDIVLLPGYLRAIEDTSYKDFISPYGYSGLVYKTCTDKSKIKKAWKEIKIYLENNVVSSFIRFELDADYSIFEEGIIPIMKNVRGKILDYETQWKNFHPKVRKNVNRAKKENLYSEIILGKEISKNNIRSFYDIYIETMKRNNAESKFFFPIENFEIFCNQNGELCAFCFIYDSERVVSVEMVLVGHDTLYSFLGGTLADAFYKRPNDYLKYVIINWARENNFRYYILGGGYGTDDGIFNYKKSFFPGDIVDYFTGQFINNKKIYSMLVHEKFGTDIPQTNFFPLYRYRT
jgi:hypothetical protein